jgi:iron complex transport system substrate-binding protein
MMRLRTLLIITFLLLLGAQCAWAEKPAAAYTDATGAKLAYGLNAKRIVSLAPNLTEMICYLGLRQKLAGRSDYCNFPPEVKRLPSVGGFADSSLEKIVALSPDLVVVYQGNSLELVQLLRAAKIRVLAFNEARSLPEIGDQMAVLAKVAGLSGSAEPKQLTAWRARLNKLTVPAGRRQSSVFFGYPGEMSMSCGPASFLGDLIDRAGGANVVKNKDERWPMVSAEFILAAKPCWLLSATSCTGGESVAARQAKLMKQLKADPVWAALPAVAQGHVLVLDSDVLLRPGPRILDALAAVRKAIAEDNPAQ